MGEVVALQTANAPVVPPEPPAKVRKPRTRVTEVLPPYGYTPPQNRRELNEGGPSAAGWSRTSMTVECPERARLDSLGVKARGFVDFEDSGAPSPMNALEFGSLMHALLGYRAVVGQDGAVKFAENFGGISEPDRIKALSCLKVYDITWPLEHEPYQYLGVEVEVFTDIGLPTRTKIQKCFRTVRYDTIVRPYIFGIDQSGNPTRTLSAEVFSLEHKTSARGGQSAYLNYTGQFTTQCAIWNANPALVERYGRMGGVIADMVIKTNTPRAERSSPLTYSDVAQNRILEYLRLPEQIKYPQNADGTAPRMFHACTNRFGVCQYFALCHDGDFGGYEVAS